MAFPDWFIAQKGLQLTEKYTDMQNAAHARAFTVVKVSQLSALAQIKKAISAAVNEGKTFSEFKKDYSGEPLREWHLKTVYQTNMQAAYMAGRHAAALEAVDTHPYWLYLAEVDAYTRPAHAALHLKAFHHSDPAWQSIIPPNGYNCRCRFVAVSEEGLEEWGVKPETSKANQRRPDKGFNSSPMAAHTVDKLLYERASEVLESKAHAFIQSVLLNPARLKGWEAFVDFALDPKTKGQRQAMAFSLLPAADIAFVKQQGASLQNGLIFLDQMHFAGGKFKRHSQVQKNGLTVEEFKALPQLFSRLDTIAGALKLWDSKKSNLIYLIPVKGGQFYKIPLGFGSNQYGGALIDEAKTIFKITKNDVFSMLEQPHIKQFR